jgi:hypothetical protein
MNPTSLPRDLLKRLWSDRRARSRNKNFDRFRDDPMYQLAVKHIYSLLNLRRQIIDFKDESRLEVVRLEGRSGARLTLTVPSLSLRRTVILSLPELQLLKEDPALEEVEVALRESGATSPDPRDRRA